jgi:hypothetical protein
MHKIAMPRPLTRPRRYIATGRVVLLIAGLLLYSIGISSVAQAAPSLSTPTLSITSDNCTIPSSLSGPNYPEPGDTLTITSRITNDTSSPASFRVVVRVTGVRGGTGANRSVDLLYGGPTYIQTSGVGGAGWDDSYGYVLNTPLIAGRATYKLQANYSLLRQQLSNALNIANGGTGSIDIKLELFSSDFSTFYGTTSVTQTIQNTAKNRCSSNTITDSSPVLLTTNKATYTTADTIHIEYSTIGADDVNKLPGWGDTGVGTVDIVRLDTLSSGNPELDYTNNSGNIVRTISTWTSFNTPTCTIPCVATDERLATSFNYSYQVGSGVQAFTNRSTVLASSLANNSTYLVRARFGAGNGSSSHPIQQPQWTYFTVGSAVPTAVTLVSFKATPQADRTLLVRWETASEYNTQGFHLYRSSDGTRSSATRITPTLIFSEGSGVTGAVYSWTDPDVHAGTSYSYWLQEVEIGGATNEYGPISATLPPSRTQPYAVFVPLLGR